MKPKKVVIISGGLGAIGSAIAKKFSDSGMMVSILYHNKNEGMENFIRNSKTKIIAIKCDLTDEKTVKEAVEETISKFGRIDVCVHCATSPLIRKRMQNISVSEFKSQFEVTTFGALNLFQKVIPEMRKSGEGKIVALASGVTNNDTGASSMAGYLSAKFALLGIIKDLAAELKNENIDVNAVSPEFVQSPLHKDLPNEVLSFIKNKMKTNTKEEVADLVFKICNEKISGINFFMKDNTNIKL